MNIPDSARQWLKTGERGISSETIFSAITGLDITQYKTHPLDTDDFRRCSLLLKAVPEWRSELYKVADLSPEWKSFVDNWIRLEELLDAQLNTKKTVDMFLFMRTLIDNAHP